MTASRAATDAGGRLVDDVFAVRLSDDRLLVYAPLVPVAFVADDAMGRTLAQLHRKTLSVDQLDENLAALLRALGLVSSSAPEPPVSRCSGPPKPTTVTLFLTTDCNLGCTYCYAAAGDGPRSVMPIDVARRGIDFVVRNAEDVGAPAVYVGFHGGGEPTRAWSVLTASHRYARERTAASGLGLVSSAATNGLLGAAKIEWIAQHLTGGLTISFDGLPEIHDRQRPTRSGQPSSPWVMHTMQALERLGCSYAIRMTVTPESVTQLADSVHFVCARFRPRAIQVEPVYALGRWQEGDAVEPTAFVEGFRAARKGAATRDIPLRFGAAQIDRLTNHFCAVSQDGFSLSPKGNVTACYEAFSEDRPEAQAFFYGRPSSDGAGYQFDSVRLDHLRRLGVEHQASCQDCFAKWHCAGDCSYKRQASGASGGLPDGRRCEITRALIVDELLERIRASGGIAWRGDDTSRRGPAASFREAPQP